MVRDLRNHAHIRPGVRQDKRVDLVHAIGDASTERVDIANRARRFGELHRQVYRLSGLSMAGTIGVVIRGGKRNGAMSWVLCAPLIRTHDTAGTR